MKTPIQPIPPAPLEELFGLIQFLRDPAAVEERAKLLEALRDDLNAKIEAVGKADEIEALRAQAGIDRAEAAREKADALEEVETIIADARARASALEEAQSEAAAGRESKLLERASETAAREAAATERAAALDAKEAAVAKRESAAAAAQAMAEALKAEYEKKLAQVRAAGLA